VTCSAGSPADRRHRYLHAPRSFDPTESAARPRGALSLYALATMSRDPIIEAIDEVVGPATPHFAYQLRARVRELIEDLPPDHPARRHGEEQMEYLDRIGHASSKAEEGQRESPERPGWDTIPSAAPADAPLPGRS
jgi:hypothetical protein